MTLVEHTLQAEEQLCFIHIPKTAGTTLISLLDAHFHLDRICPVQLWRELIWLPKEQLPHYELLRGHYTYDDYQALVPNPVFVSMFRNPIDRACSYYNFMRNQSEDWLERHYSYRDALAEPHPHVAALVEGDIEIYQRANRDDLPTFFASSFVQNWIQNWHVRAIARSTFDETPIDEGAVLERAKERLHTLAWFGLVERFEESMALLSYAFGWNPIRQYQRLMVAPNPNYTEGLPTQTIDTLHEIHHLDKAFYQYAADCFTERYDTMQQQLQGRYASSSGSTDANEAVYGWLEQHYRDRTQAQSLPPQTIIDLKFDQPIAGTGWHLREGSAEDQSIFRWTGPETQSTLDLPLEPGQAFTLKLRIVGAISEQVLDSLQASVGDYNVPLTQLWREVRPGIYLVLVEGTIPAAAVAPDAPFTRLTFSVRETRSLQSLDPANPDRRPVGVAMNWISVFPQAEPCADGYRYMVFPGDDAAWLETVRWLRSHSNLIHRVIAPLEFVEVLPRQVLTYGLLSDQPATDADWMVIHKGQLDAISLPTLAKVEATWTPVFANVVFVVFTNRSEVEAIAPTDADLNAFREDFIKLFNSREFVAESADSAGSPLSNEEYRYIRFPATDPAWDATVRWLRSHRNLIHQAIAPFEFTEVLPKQVLPYDALTEQRPDGVDWVVIHKGMLDLIPLSLLKQVERQWNPVYANAVFVVLTTRMDMEAIAAKNSDLKAFRTAYTALTRLASDGSDEGSLDAEG